MLSHPQLQYLSFRMSGKRKILTYVPGLHSKNCGCCNSASGEELKKALPLGLDVGYISWNILYGYIASMRLYHFCNTALI